MNVFSAIISALLLSARIVLPGFGWTCGRPARSWMDRLGRIVVFGLLLNLLPALFLGATGCWTPSLDWLTWALVTVLGIGLNRHRLQGWRDAATGLTSALAMITITAFLPLLLPVRSEWVAGGWDPGIYQNNAVAIAHRNGLTPLKNTVFEALNIHDRLLLSDSSEIPYHELMPGIPMQLRDGSLPLYFQPLTPVCGAWFYRIGGLAMLVRMPAVMAFLGLLPFLSLCGMIRLSKIQQGLAVGFLLLSPMWWYHQAVPTSEWLYLIWIYGGLVFYLQAAEERRRIPVAAALVLFAMTVNHFNAPVIASVFLLIAAIAESAMNLPHRQTRLAACFGSLLAGMCWGVHSSWITLSRLQEKDAALSIILGVILISGAMAYMLAWRPRTLFLSLWNFSLTRLAAQTLVMGLLLLTIFLSNPRTHDGVLSVFYGIPLAGSFLYHYSRVMAFHGGAWFLLMFCGVLIQISSGKNPSRALCGLVVLALGSVFALLLASPGITPIYPWALRRTMIVAIPFMAITQACAAAWAIEKRKEHRAGQRLILWVLIGMAVWGGLHASRHASRVGDYAGLPTLLDKINRHLQTGDVVVVDDARWGTPLMMMYGRDVVNGEHFLKSDATHDTTAFLEVIQQIEKQHRGRVLWLTSHEAGLAAYPITPPYTKTIAENIPFEYRTVIHGADVHHFRTESRHAVFNLYEQITPMKPPLTLTHPGPYRLLVDLSGEPPVALTELRWGGLDVTPAPSPAGWQIIDLPQPPPNVPLELQWTWLPGKEFPPQFLLYAPGDPLHLIYQHGCLYPAGTRTPGRHTGESPEFPLPFSPDTQSVMVHLSSDLAVAAPIECIVSLGGEACHMKLNEGQTDVARLFPIGDAPRLHVLTPAHSDDLRLNIKLQPLCAVLNCIPQQTGIYVFQTFDEDGTSAANIARFLVEGTTHRIESGDNRLIGACLSFYPANGNAPYQSNLEDDAFLQFDGFHPREDTGQFQHPYQRWTGSENALIQIAAPPTSDVDIGIRLRNVRPPKAAAHHIFLEVGASTYPVTFSNTLWSETIHIPANDWREDGNNSINIQLHSDTWSPAAIMPSGDTRTLGILLDDLWLHFTPRPASARPATGEAHQGDRSCD